MRSRKAGGKKRIRDEAVLNIRKEKKKVGYKESYGGERKGQELRKKKISQ